MKVLMSCRVGEGGACQGKKSDYLEEHLDLFVKSLYSVEKSGLSVRDLGLKAKSL
jgi:hypothetical protein